MNRAPGPPLASGRRMIRVLAVFACTSVLLFAACSNQGFSSSCGPALYAATVNGEHKVQISSCAGNFPLPPLLVNATVGDTIKVRLHGGFSIGYPAPKPADSSVVSISRQTSDVVTLTARAAGRTDLLVASVYCVQPPACAIFQVTVTG